MVKAAGRARWATRESILTHSDAPGRVTPHQSATARTLCSNQCYRPLMDAQSLTAFRVASVIPSNFGFPVNRQIISPTFFSPCGTPLHPMALCGTSISPVTNFSQKPGL